MLAESNISDKHVSLSKTYNLFKQNKQNSLHPNLTSLINYAKAFQTTKCNKKNIWHLLLHLHNLLADFHVFTGALLISCSKTHIVAVWELINMTLNMHTSSGIHPRKHKATKPLKSPRLRNHTHYMHIIQGLWWFRHTDQSIIILFIKHCVLIMCLCLASAADVSAVTQMNDGANKRNINLFLFGMESIMKTNGYTWVIYEIHYFLIV